MTLKQLMELRAQKTAAIGDIVKQKGEIIAAADLSVMKTLQDEIGDIDNQIQAIQIQRDVALENVKPNEEKQVDATEKIQAAFVAHLKGDMEFKQYEKLVAAMQSGTATAGAELVPPEFLKVLLEKIKEHGSLFDDVDIIETANNGELSIPTADDTSNTGVWTDESGAITLVDFVTGKKTLAAYKVASATSVSNELIEDSFFDIGTYVAGLLGVRLNRAAEAAFINGDGVKKPLGILPDTSTIEVISATIGAVEHNDALALIAALQPASRKGAFFYGSDEFILWMSEQKDTTGRPIYQTNASATAADEIKYSIGGYMVKPNYELGAIVAGDNPLIFGNPKQYLVRLVRGIRVQRSDQLKILEDETVFVATARLDGKMTTMNNGFSKLTVRTV